MKQTGISFATMMFILLFLSVVQSQHIKTDGLYEVKSDTVSKMKDQTIIDSGSENQLSEIDVSKFDTHNRHGGKSTEAKPLKVKKVTNLNAENNKEDKNN